LEKTSNISRWTRIKVKRGRKKGINSGRAGGLGCQIGEAMEITVLGDGVLTLKQSKGGDRKANKHIYISVK